MCFAAAGATPLLVARDEAALAAVAALTGGVPLQADLNCSEDVEGLWERAEAAVGQVSVLVNNAGIVEPGNFADSDSSMLDRMMQVNVLAPMRLCRDAIRSMQMRGGGHLVNVSSLAGVAATPGLASYSASKAALSHFTRVLAVELSGQPMLGHAKEHLPTQRSFRRTYRLGLLVDVPASTVAEAVVQGRPLGKSSRPTATTCRRLRHARGGSTRRQPSDPRTGTASNLTTGPALAEHRLAHVSSAARGRARRLTRQQRRGAQLHDGLARVSWHRSSFSAPAPRRLLAPTRTCGRATKGTVKG